MHPMATLRLAGSRQGCCLEQPLGVYLFCRRLGRRERPGSYGDFISSQPVEINRKLNLYTADRLFDYFSSALSSDNRDLRETLREIVKDY